MTDEAKWWRPDQRIFTGWITDICTSLMLFTRLPMAKRAERTDGSPASFPLGDAARAFPVAGMIIGALVGMAFCIAAVVGLPTLVAAVLAVAVQAALTGAMHEDALGDLTDSFGGRDTDHRFAILDDSRLGTFGVVAVVLALLARVALIAALADMTSFWAILPALVAAGGVSRAAPVVLAFLVPPAREEGLGADLGRPGKAVMIQAVGLALLASLLLIHVLAALAGLVLAVAAGWYIGAVAQRQLGGHTGDVLGTTQIVTEIAFLLGLCLLAAV